MIECFCKDMKLISHAGRGARESIFQGIPERGSIRDSGWRPWGSILSYTLNDYSPEMHDAMETVVLRPICALGALVLAVSLAAGSVVINEMELNPPQGVTEWVELYNDGGQPVNISGWTVIVTDGGWVGRMTAPSGTVIPPRGYFVLTGSQQWSHQNGGSAVLFDQSGAKLDETPFRQDDWENDLTWGRHPNGRDTDKSGDWGLGSATRGARND
jgi:hypothetical protein